MTLASDLHAIADRLQRLAPSHRDPFKFHEDKSELVNELRRLAGGMPKIAHTPANDNRLRGAIRRSGQLVQKMHGLPERQGFRVRSGQQPPETKYFGNSE